MCPIYMYAAVPGRNWTLFCCTIRLSYRKLPLRAGLIRAVKMHEHLISLCSPALNGSSALQHFECGNMVEIHNEIMFDFYPRLPHIQLCCWLWVWYSMLLLINFSVVGVGCYITFCNIWVVSWNVMQNLALWNVLECAYDILIKFLLSITFDISSCWYKLLTAVAVCIVSVALTNDLHWDLHQYRVQSKGTSWQEIVWWTKNFLGLLQKKRVRIDQWVYSEVFPFQQSIIFISNWVSVPFLSGFGTKCFEHC